MTRLSFSLIDRLCRGIISQKYFHASSFRGESFLEHGGLRSILIALHNLSPLFCCIFKLVSLIIGVVRQAGAIYAEKHVRAVLEGIR